MGTGARGGLSCIGDADGDEVFVVMISESCEFDLGLQRVMRVG